MPNKEEATILPMGIAGYASRGHTIEKLYCLNITPYSFTLEFSHLFRIQQSHSG